MNEQEGKGLKPGVGGKSRANSKGAQPNAGTTKLSHHIKVKKTGLELKGIWGGGGKKEGSVNRGHRLVRGTTTATFHSKSQKMNRCVKKKKKEPSRSARSLEQRGEAS